MANPLGAAPGILVGVGVGNAASAALEPLIEPQRQNAWSDHPNRVLDPGIMARLVAQGGVPLGTGQAQALREGVKSDKFDWLVWLAQHLPELGTLTELARRKLIGPAELQEALTRHGFPQSWHAPLIQRMQDILSPGELSAAIHRGLVPDPGLLRGEQPSGPFKVEAYPVYDIDALQEAAGSGYNHDRLGVLVGLQGLPMGTHEAAEAYFRGIITHGDYIRAFNESNSRNEWAQAVLDYTRQIPTARDFMENALRGHHTFAWAAEQAARHGMTKEDAFLIYQNQGRPLNLHQITQALAWGAKYNPGEGDNPDPWMQSVLLGAVRPEYYEMQDALKYNLPSAFYFRSLQEQNVLSETEAEKWYLRLGWPPELAQKVAAAYSTGAATADADPYVKKAETQLWTAIHKAFVRGEIDAATADTYLTNLVTDPVARARVIQLWETEANLGARSGPPA